jgi:uncharacterized protein YjiS (DUF1127 family)
MAGLRFFPLPAARGEGYVALQEHDALYNPNLLITEPVMAVFAHSRPLAEGVFGGAFSFGGLVATIASWNDRRITRRELSRLSDRELEDIGLCRADIDLIVDRIG